MRVDIRLAQRLELIKPSSTLAITSRAKKLKAEGLDIVNLSAGEPDFDTPDFVKDASCKRNRPRFYQIYPYRRYPRVTATYIRKVKRR